MNFHYGGSLSVKKDRYIKPIEHIIFHCGNLLSEEKVLVLYDEKTELVSSLFKDYMECNFLNYEYIKIPYSCTHGTEPNNFVANKMLSSDLIIGLTSTSIAHTFARKNACDNGARYLSLPDYSIDLLQHPSILTDYVKRAITVKKVSDILSQGNSIRVLSKKGTDIWLPINGRLGNCCPGYVKNPGDLGSPPDIEANIAPVEGAARGIIVTDGAIPCKDIGLLNDDVTLLVKDGNLVKIKSQNKDYVDTLNNIFSDVGSIKAYNIAEFGVGLNEMCTLTGNMLTDEGSYGTVHFGIGSNATIGGKNDVSFHLDFVIRNPTVIIDDLILINEGDLVI